MSFSFLVCLCLTLIADQQFVKYSKKVGNSSLFAMKEIMTSCTVESVVLGAEIYTISTEANVTRSPKALRRRSC